MRNECNTVKTKGGGIGGFFNSIGNVFLRLSLKYMPDPAVFAVLFTFLSFILGVLVAKQKPLAMVAYWYTGFWELLSFSMQISLGVVTGSAVADAPAVKKWIRKVASIPKNSIQAVALSAVMSISFHYIHWGLGLIVGAIFAKETARALKKKNIPFEYGLIAAAGYAGEMTWHGGLSASVGLLIAQPGHFLEDKIGVIPFKEYLINPMNIAICTALLVLVPVFACLLHPKEGKYQPLSAEAMAVLDAEDVVIEKVTADSCFGDKLSHSKVLAALLGILGWVYIVYHFATKGFALDMNIVNTIFLFTGIILHTSIAGYVKAVKDSIGGISGIVFQFPLYAGVLGMVKYSGLVTIIASGIVGISNELTFPALTFISASIVNLFVPSGGGQWAVQGPIAIESAQMMGANVLKTCLAVAYGNTWTNMAQPFWAIALLGITGLKAKDMMGYSIGIMLMSGFIFILGLTFLPV